MSNNMIQCNVHLHQAYQHLTSCNLDRALEQYQRALKLTYNNQLKSNIKCTIAIIEHNRGNQDLASEHMHQIFTTHHNQQSSVVMIRALANFILVHILENKFSKAVDYFELLLQNIECEKSLCQKKGLIDFVTYLFFRVNNLEDISEYIQSMDLTGMKLEEIYCMSMMAFNSQICSLQCQERVQKMCYQQYIKHNRYDLAIFSLRTLIRFCKSNINKQFYEKQLGKLIVMGYFSEEIDYNNFQAYEIVEMIAVQFINYKNKVAEDIRKMEMKNALSQPNNLKYIESSNGQLLVQWRYTLNLMHKQAVKNKDMQEDTKRYVLQILNSIRQETNVLVIRSMAKNNYFAKYHQKVQVIFKRLANFLKNEVKAIINDAFTILKAKEAKMIPLKQRDETRSRLNLTNQKSRKSFSNIAKWKVKQNDKQNNPLGISIVSIASSKLSKDHARKKIFENNSLASNIKKINKMMKMCEHGCFLNKRNFNSEGGEYRFVKINSNFIKWGKDPEKIETNCQIYPLKDIRSIIYGRVSPNLNQNSNKMLSYSKCFSLLLQKRTLDFYCKSYEELQAWVCGLTSVLKRQNSKIVGYTPGKLRWKKMFALLKESFIEPLKVNDRCKYYNQNAYSLILFGKNNYQLPKIPKER